MSAQSEESYLQSWIDLMSELRFLLLLIFSLVANADALQCKLTAIDTAKRNFRTNLDAGNIAIASSIVKEIVRYYDEVDDYHVVIDNGLNQVSSILQRVKAMTDLEDLTEEG
ncbi:hypothetical protein N7540_011849 [Penicillium herquei]|nr:hypothetical protein N7540_011849 [Penicillium herquei]